MRIASVIKLIVFVESMRVAQFPGIKNEASSLLNDEASFQGIFQIASVLRCNLSDLVRVLWLIPYCAGVLLIGGVVTP